MKKKEHRRSEHRRSDIQSETDIRERESDMQKNTDEATSHHRLRAALESEATSQSETDSGERSEVTERERHNRAKRLHSKSDITE